MMLRRRSTAAERDEHAPTYALSRALSGLLLVGIGAAGLVNSWGAMYAAALVHTRGTHLGSAQVMGVSISLAAATLPAVIDLLIVAGSWRYLIGVRRRIPVAGWRVTAHTAIAVSVLMNAAAAERPADWPWHVVAPLSLSIVIELFVRELLGTLGEVRRQGRGDRIPLRLWITAPVESARTWLMIARRVTGVQALARAEAGQRRASMLLVRIVLPGRRHTATRRTLAALTRTGALPPQAVAALVSGHRADPSGILPAALDQVASGVRPDARTAVLASDPSGNVRLMADVAEPSVRTPRPDMTRFLDEIVSGRPASGSASGSASGPDASGLQSLNGHVRTLPRPVRTPDAGPDADAWAAWEASGRPSDWTALGAQLGIGPEAARKRASRRPPPDGPDAA